MSQSEEEAIVSSLNETEHDEEEHTGFSMSNFLWDACSGWCLGLYGLVGSWTAYLVSVLYVEYRSRKEREGMSFKNHVIQWFEVLDGLLGPFWKALGLAFNCTFLLFGSVIQLIACARIWSSLGLGMTTYTAWYLTAASLAHGQVIY
ncbi:hypothetical protein SASPL_105401 [Salvia splendens]|uniref:Amino acid transporter transmembrane domain-containing protein n=1 Tax=Salvia splendens TaxID=180675 RepID=A0A8X9ABJ9_SALSN|nr:hypothetical protein SASPL_105401 [Salvia splendens]